MGPQLALVALQVVQTVQMAPQLTQLDLQMLQCTAGAAAFKADMGTSTALELFSLTGACKDASCKVSIEDVK